VEEASPHIILSDVLMPRMSGIELVKQLKGNLDTCHIPVVLLTARTEIEQNLVCLP
jgi:CheY-like chemotaxis protein